MSDQQPKKLEQSVDPSRQHKVDVDAVDATAHNENNASQNSNVNSGLTTDAAKSSQPSIILAARQLGKTFVEGHVKTVVLQDIDFSINEGEMIAICGASGSGKSTLLHLLGGLDTPTTGHVELMQRDLWKINEAERCQLRNRHLGFVYQFHHLLPEFDVLENVMMPLLIAGEKKKQAKDRAKDLLNKVGLDKRITHRVGEISGGERQRVAIARALVTNPSCVLADEPTGNLDVATAMHVFDLMLELNQSLGTCFLLVTHNEDLAMRMQKQWNLADGHFS